MNDPWAFTFEGLNPAIIGTALSSSLFAPRGRMDDIWNGFSSVSMNFWISPMNSWSLGNAIPVEKWNSQCTEKTNSTDLPCLVKISIFNLILTANVIQSKIKNPIEQTKGLINEFHFVSEFLYTKQYTDFQCLGEVAKLWRHFSWYRILNEMRRNPRTIAENICPK